MDVDEDGWGDALVLSPYSAGSDCDDANPAVFLDNLSNESEGGCYVDVDEDGWGDATALDPYDAGTDCNDASASQYPGHLYKEGDAGCYQDSDSDGWGDVAAQFPFSTGSDCNDGSSAVFPGNLFKEGDLGCYMDADSDGWGDGAAQTPYEAGSDCDDDAPAVFPGNLYKEGDEGCYQDGDGDGWGDAAAVTPYDAGTDCDDSKVAIYPGNIPTESNPGGCYLDDDSDGWGDSATGTQYDPGTDCDDANAAVYPGNARFESNTAGCFVDIDSDGWGDIHQSAPYTAGSDCDDANNFVCPGSSREPDQSLCVQDADGDGWGDINVAPMSGYSAGTDCDDTDGTTFPGAAVFEDSAACVHDADGDGHGDAIAEPPFDAGGDCDDSAPAVNPSALEFCDDIDNNCDEAIDEATAIDAATWVLDADGDGFGTADAAVQAHVSCATPASYVASNDDCDDSTNTVFPGASESCNEVDDDCDGATDEGVDSTAPLGAPTWYQDADGDSYGNAAVSTLSCEVSTGYVANQDDCNDGNNTVSPDAIERCNDIDDDCDGATDEADATDASTWYLDADGDGFPSETNTESACEAPTGHLAPGAEWDCNDLIAAIHPDADETCNSADDNCDGLTDGDDSIDRLPFYLDADTDGFGDPSQSMLSCTKPDSHVMNADDCDDDDIDQFPGGEEVCNGDDDDCDGISDESDAVDVMPWYQDSDGDTYGIEAVSSRGCAAPSGFTGTAGDCDDADDTQFPGGEEKCNGEDDDCDGLTDETESENTEHGFAVDLSTFYLDADGDDFGLTDSPTDACTVPENHSDVDGDCDDYDILVFPGQLELCDPIDQNCDGDSTLGAVDPQVWYVDADRDNYGSLDTPFWSCEPPFGFVADSTDCDDSADDVSPVGIEICNGRLDNCVSGIATVDGIPEDEHDEDEDGHVECILDVALGSWLGQVTVVGGEDCDDSRPNSFPGATVDGSSRW